MRDDISFESEGTTCRGWLYRPREETRDQRRARTGAWTQAQGGAGPGPESRDPESPQPSEDGPSAGKGRAGTPVVVMAHGLGGVIEMGLDAYAQRFAEAGYACLVFDYRHFGGSDGEPRQLLDIGRQLQDWQAAVAFARSHEELDPRRVVLWGTSFSGGHVLRAGAEDHARSRGQDERVAAVISQCPFTDGLASMRAMDLGTIARDSALAMLDALGALVGRDPVMIPLAGEPGSTALMTAPDVLEGYRSLIPEDLEFREEVTARAAMRIPLYRPGRSAAKLPCPVLFCVCEKDSVAPADATLRHVRKAPRGTVEVFPIGHFDLYQGEAFEGAVELQIRFLEAEVPVA